LLNALLQLKTLLWHANVFLPTGHRPADIFWEGVIATCTIFGLGKMIVTCCT